MKPALTARRPTSNQSGSELVEVTGASSNFTLLKPHPLAETNRRVYVHLITASVFRVLFPIIPVRFAKRLARCLLVGCLGFAQIVPELSMVVCESFSVTIETSHVMHSLEICG